MTDDELWFLQTLDDLKEKINPANTYKLIRSSGLLRQLLIDGKNTLIHLVNRTYKIQLKFVVNGNLEPKLPSNLKIGLEARWLALYPRKGAPTTSLKLSQFLDHMVFEGRGSEFSVSDYIRTAANALGGVHRGSLDEMPAKHLELASFMSQIMYNENDIHPFLECLHEISLVVIDGVKPLRELIEKNKDLAR